MFDGIAYGKASDVLLSVENYLGTETFRKGVHAYLSAHLYSNATAEDFWNAQTAASGKPVDKIMDSLVAQPGVPLLTFSQPANGQVSVQQRRFFLSPSSQPDPSQKWTLPVCFKTSSPVDQDCHIVTPATSTLKIPGSTLFFANAGGKGYYRSAYPPSVYKTLVDNLETALTPSERISLTGDEWAQVRANKATVDDYLNLAAALKSDPNAPVLSEAISGVDTIVSRLAATPDEKAALAVWIRRTFTPVYAGLGQPSPSDTPNTRALRTELFGLLGGYGKDPAILAQAAEIANKYIADPSSVDPALGETAVAIAATNGDAALFDKLQHVYETSTNPSFQEAALRLLAMFENPALVRRALDYAVSSKVRNQDAAIQFAIALQVTANRDQAWSYIKSHWDQVKAQITTDSGAYVVSGAGSFCSADARDDVQNFFSTHKLAATEQTLKHSIERINGCIEFRALQEPNLQQWLAMQPAQ
jgi:aminopeptidase N/puromycin-sensitive aminopeptidase